MAMRPVDLELLALVARIRHDAGVSTDKETRDAFMSAAEKVLAMVSPSARPGVK